MSTATPRFRTPMGCVTPPDSLCVEGETRPTRGPSMSTLTPTREELAEIARFGIYDADEIADLEDRVRDVAPCALCPRGARWRLTRRCCAESVLKCDRHKRRHLRALGRFLRPRRGKVAVVVCGDCGHVFPLGSTVDDILTVVTA